MNFDMDKALKLDVFSNRFKIFRNNPSVLEKLLYFNSGKI